MTKIYSIVGLLPPDTPLIRHQPFRAPRHAISHSGLAGGGHWPRLGEISLAHHGVLFLDELPEFGTRTLEGLRQPLEDGVVSTARAIGTLAFPAPLCAHPGHNPLSLRLLWRPGARVHVLDVHGQPLPTRSCGSDSCRRRRR